MFIDKNELSGSTKWFDFHWYKTLTCNGLWHFFSFSILSFAPRGRSQEPETKARAEDNSQSRRQKPEPETKARAAKIEITGAAQMWGTTF